MFPLMAMLLCVSHRSFFLEMWTNFIPLCLLNLKQKDVALQRTSLNLISRVIWVYSNRIGGESNEITDKKLRTVSEILFPPKSQMIVPKDEPDGAFIEVIQSMALVSV